LNLPKEKKVPHVSRHAVEAAAKPKPTSAVPGKAPHGVPHAEKSSHAVKPNPAVKPNRLEKGKSPAKPEAAQSTVHHHHRHKKVREKGAPSLLRLKLDAFSALRKHYAAVWRAAWAHRKEMEPPKLMAHEAEFLPSALSLQVTPTSPAPHVAIALLISIVIVTLVWACLGKIDVVATAQGKIVPNERTKTIQSLTPAIIKAIHVQDGQQVKKGDVLIELDTSQVQADVSRLRSDLSIYKLQVARSQAMLDSLDQGKEEKLVCPDGLAPSDCKDAVEHFHGQYAEYVANLAAAKADLLGKQADLISTEQSVKKLKLNIPLLTKQVSDLQNLAVQHYVPEHQYLEKKQDLISMEGDLGVQEGHLKEAQAAIEEAQSKILQTTAQVRRNNLDQLTDGRQKADSTAQELVKSQTQSKQMTLRAPVDGVVQQLAVHTIGGVVQQAQNLMVIVPYDDALEVEAYIQNRDIGFVHAGQSVEIKIEAFPYTKYGVIHGSVISVSEDAIQDEKKGLIYQTLIKMNRSTIEADGRQYQLSPGMSVTAEIKTDQRRVIQYFLSPLIAYKSDSLKER
jgi:hemolysin D